jgi:ATP-dependent helicase YprA (DUF1998 family)
LNERDGAGQSERASTFFRGSKSLGASLSIALHRTTPDRLHLKSRDMAPQTKVDRAFSALTPALSEWILEAVDAMGFVKTTPVQHAAIPMFMKNSDVVVEAVTGSGKTLA